MNVCIMKVECFTSSVCWEFWTSIPFRLNTPNYPVAMTSVTVTLRGVDLAKYTICNFCGELYDKPNTAPVKSPFRGLPFKDIV